MFFDEGRDPRPIGLVDVHELNADPTIFETAADNRSTADLAHSGQLEPQPERPAHGVAVIQLEEGSAGTENHEAPIGSHLASGVIDPHVNVEADLRAWELPTVGRRCPSLCC